MPKIPYRIFSLFIFPFSFSVLEIVIHPEKIFAVGQFVITNTLLMAWLVVAIFFIAGVLFKKQIQRIPSRAQTFVEFAVGGFFNFVEEILESRDIAKKAFPLVATIFFFVLISNWFGILPVLGALGLYEHGEHGETIFVPLFRSSASDLNFTLALAIIAVIAVQIFGMRQQGFFKHWRKYFTIRNPIETFVGILEFISEFAKMVSFSFRLFGNIFAGEVLLLIVGFLAPYFIPLPFLFLEIFVGFIQALVFAMLTLVFIKIAVANHGTH
jgi:F-type H+-transporting ATPase subunit a